MPAVPATVALWSERADAAEAAIVDRHLTRLWQLPGTQLAVVGWPSVRRERLFLNWHYWWQAHLIDCLVDAARRNPSPARRRRLVRLIRSHRIRNISGWTNSYYDDMAWLGLALERAERVHNIDHREAIATLEKVLYDAWAPERGGGIPWCVGSDFYNAPANGPAGILLARTGKLLRAVEMADWIDATLHDPETDLIFDGTRPDRGPDSLERAIYTYCQGVTLGLETELAMRGGASRHAERVHRLVRAVDEHLTDRGVVNRGGGGDGGLFSGILARQLGVVAVSLPGETDDDLRARAGAASIVLTSAEAAWSNRLEVNGLPLFGARWTENAQLASLDGSLAAFRRGTVRASDVAERDLSVQLSGWMLMEAAYRVSAAGF